MHPKDAGRMANSVDFPGADWLFPEASNIEDKAKWYKKIDW